MLANSPVCKRALESIDLLKDVVGFKQRFCPCAWARYDLAVPGSLRLLPKQESQIEHLHQDYQGMQVMLFGDPPAFSQVLSGLSEIESRINDL